MSSHIEDIESGYTSYNNSHSYNSHYNYIDVNNNNKGQGQELTLWSRLSRVIYSMFDRSTYQSTYNSNSSSLPRYVCSSDNV